MAHGEPLLDTPIARHVWETRYRLARPRTMAEREVDVTDTWRRVAAAVAAAEPVDARLWQDRFFDILQEFRFLPGGRILAGAGTRHRVTLLNCFVIGRLGTDAATRARQLREAARTMAHGGGIGIDLSPLEPTDGAPGIVAMLEEWDAMCAAVGARGPRRGAMMATLRCDHPDILAFVNAKRHRDRLHHFNLSVLVTDDFMHAVDADLSWPLRSPHRFAQIVSTHPARHIWRAVAAAAHVCGDPGLLFIDRVNHENNLSYAETISATNPCGEVPLPPYGACDLGSINLARLVRNPFTAQARIEPDDLAALATVAVRFLDNVIDVTSFPVQRQETVVRASRRLGLGITGLADAFIMMGLRYGRERSIAIAGDWMQAIRDAAYRASVALAREKGSFPLFDRDHYLAAPFIRTLPPDIRDGIARNGIRNSHLLAIAPTGTISLLAGNVSSGIEPVFAESYQRRVVIPGAAARRYDMTDFAVRAWRSQVADPSARPPGFLRADQIPAEAQIALQAALQRHVDNAISKTVTLSASAGIADVEHVFRTAHRLGLKGCTVFRAGAGGADILGPASCSAMRLPSGRSTPVTTPPSTRGRGFG
ncbi:MAG: adenosylcobalamin-dependent ribonucleoside-diphosphate reductase [Acetobacteraceae bacterium]